MTLWGLAAREVAGAKDQPLDPLTARQRFYYFRHVRQRDSAIKEMIGLDQDTNAAGTLIEAARLADPRLDLRQTARGDLFL